MESSPFLYYNPGNTSHQSRQHGQFVSHPPCGLSPQQKSACIDRSPPTCTLTMPYPSTMMYSSPRLSNIHTPHALTAEALQKSSGLLTPSSPTLLGLDGPNGSDVYFFPSTPTLESSDNSSAMSSHLTTPINQPWALEDGCNGTITPAELEMPSTPQFWKERSPLTPGMLGNQKVHNWRRLLISALSCRLWLPHALQPFLAPQPDTNVRLVPVSVTSMLRPLRIF